MKFKDITLENISNFIEGYGKWFIDNLLPRHTKEQILWRASQCPPECYKERKCHYCGCEYPQKLYVKKSCNLDKKLPSLMNEESWNLFKEKLKNEKDNKLS
jgi:hypothetical protein